MIVYYYVYIYIYMHVHVYMCIHTRHWANIVIVPGIGRMIKKTMQLGGALQGVSQFNQIKNLGIKPTTNECRWGYNCNVRRFVQKLEMSSHKRVEHRDFGEGSLESQLNPPKKYVTEWVYIYISARQYSVLCLYIYIYICTHSSSIYFCFWSIY